MRDAPQSLDQIRDSVQRRSPFRDRFAHRLLEDRGEEIVLVPEIEIDRSRHDSSRARDVSDLRVEEPSSGEELDGGPQDSVTLVPTGQRTGGQRPARARVSTGVLGPRRETLHDAVAVRSCVGDYGRSCCKTALACAASSESGSASTTRSKNLTAASMSPMFNAIKAHLKSGFPQTGSFM